MNIAETSIRNKTITLVMTAMIILGGMYCYDRLGRLEDPEFTVKEAQVFTSYPGATAMEVAQEVTDRLEIAIQEMGQLKEITSISEPGLSTIRVEIKNKYDKSTLPQVWDELRRKVGDAQAQLPPGTSQSLVFDDFGDVFGVLYAVYGDGFSYAELREYAKVLRRELLLEQDVGKVVLFGEQKEVIYVEISRARSAQLGIAPNIIYQSLAGQNLVAPSGNVKVDSKYIRIDPTGEFTSVEDIGNLLILQDDATATRLYLKDVAHIYRDYVDPPTKMMHFNGRPAIGIGISTVQGGNVITMGNALSNRLRELEADTPIGLEIGVVSHQADAVNASVSGFVISLAEAIAIVVGILMLAMGLRSGLLIGLILLLTVFSTFIFMFIYGIMLERISLGALIIALGMLVDNAIVVVEGILINMQRGMKRVEAAAAIVKQTIWPLFGATIVAILAFAAIGVSQDSTGEFCRSLFQVVMISLLMSWVLAITVTPLLGVMFLKTSTSKENFDPYGGIFFRVYKAFLCACVNKRWLTLIVLMIMLAISLRGFGFVKRSFFPESTRPQFMIHYWLPQGTHIDRTRADLALLEQRIVDVEGVTDVSSFTGGGALRFLLTYSPEENNSAYGMLLVGVDDYRKNDEIMKKVIGLIRDNMPDPLVFARKFVLGPGDPSKIQARFRGPDPDVLRNLADQAYDIIRDEPTATDLLDDWRQRTTLVRPIVAETQARNAGITRSDIAKALQSTFEGVQIGQYREQDELLAIVARSPKIERQDIDNINDVQIWSPVANQAIPIRQVVLGFETRSENSIIRRRNRVPTIIVKCDPLVGEASDVFHVLRPKIETIKLPPGYSLEWGGEYEDSGDAQAALNSKLPVTGILMVLVVVFLFNSIRQPIIIFLTVPLAIIGVSAGLLALDQPFGFMALLGFLSLAGMLIKNAIVLIDEINLQSSQGLSVYDAIIGSGVSRLRPVSMAALTTVLGMVPLLADAFFIAMAVTIMFGLAFATVLTLIVVPVLYAIFYRAKPTTDGGD